MGVVHMFCNFKTWQSAILLCMTFLCGISPASSGETFPYFERTYSMGFTRWPSELSAQGVQQADNFIAEHADLVSIMFVGGIPWQEALENKPFSQDVQNNLAYRVPDGHELLLSISPLDHARKQLALYWGKSDNQPLPEEWAVRRFNSFEVIQAFVNFTLRSVEALNPNYLAIGIETNALLTDNPLAWEDYKEFHKKVYVAVKQKHPNLPVFFTIEYNHYRGYAGEAVGTPQEEEVEDLMQFSDVVAISSYPHMSHATPWPIQDNHFDFAKQLNKPIGIAETGMSSKPTTVFDIPLRGSEEDQSQYYDILLKTAARDNYLFVATFATTDFDKLVKQLEDLERSGQFPSGIAELAKIWQFTGLQSGDGTPKSALTKWDAFLKLQKLKR